MPLTSLLRIVNEITHVLDALHKANAQSVVAVMVTKHCSPLQEAVLSLPTVL